MIPVFVALAIYYGESIRRGAPLEWQRFAAIIVFLLAAASDGLWNAIEAARATLKASRTAPSKIPAQFVKAARSLEKLAVTAPAVNAARASRAVRFMVVRLSRRV